MIFEFAVVAVIYLAGVLFLSGLGLRGWGLGACGFLAGAFILVTVGFLQVIADLSTSPIWSLLLTVLLPLGLWLWSRFHPLRQSMHWKELTFVAAGLCAVAFVVLFTYRFNLVKYHIDSFRYLLSSWLLASNHYDMASINLVTKRNLTVPIMHFLGRLYHDGYVRSITPLVSLSLLATLSWFYSIGAKSAQGRLYRYAVGVAMIMLVASNNRYIFNSFYVNGHMYFGACFTVIAASGWLLATSTEVPRAALLGFIAIAIPALVVTRPEAPLAAALAIAPLSLSPTVTWRSRAFVLAVFGISTAVWSGYIVMTYVDATKDVPVSASGLLALGIAALPAIPIIAWPGFTSRFRYVLFAAEAIIWLALACLVVLDPGFSAKSFAATYENLFLGAGSWGSSVAVLGVLVAITLLFCRDTSLVYLRFPVTASIPMFLLLANFRGSPYRVGNGDSLNRMLIELVPLAVLYIGVALTSECWEIPARVTNWRTSKGQNAASAASGDV